METIGVVGLGVVGRTVEEAFAGAGLPTKGYDLYRGEGTLEDLASSSVVFLCVPTPPAGSGQHDLSEVWAAVRTLDPHVADGTIVAVKSTVPPGTTDRLSGAFPRLVFASVPEFLVADHPMESFTHPDRVLVGCRSRKAAARLADLMTRVAPFAPVIILRPAEAELVKLCSNAMLAAKVAMANELFEVCSRFGVEWPRVQGVVGLDRRIGPSHLTVTTERGFGGTCLPKDLDGLISAAAGAGYAPGLLEEIAGFNRRIRSGSEEGLEDGPLRASNGRAAQGADEDIVVSDGGAVPTSVVPTTGG